MTKCAYINEAIVPHSIIYFSSRLIKWTSCFRCSISKLSISVVICSSSIKLTKLGDLHEATFIITIADVVIITAHFKNDTCHIKTTFNWMYLAEATPNVKRRFGHWSVRTSRPSRTWSCEMNSVMEPPSGHPCPSRGHQRRFTSAPQFRNRLYPIVLTNGGSSAEVGNKKYIFWWEAVSVNGVRDAWRDAPCSPHEGCGYNLKIMFFFVKESPLRWISLLNVWIKVTLPSDSGWEIHLINSASVVPREIDWVEYVSRRLVSGIKTTIIKQYFFHHIMQLKSVHMEY